MGRWVWGYVAGGLLILGALYAFLFWLAANLGDFMLEIGYFWGSIVDGVFLFGVM